MRRSRSGTSWFSMPPFVLSLSLVLGYELTSRMVPQVWDSMLPGGLDQARFFQGWPGLLFWMAAACYDYPYRVVAVLLAVAATGFLISAFARPLRPIVWLMVAAAVGINAGIVYVTLRTAIEAKAFQAQMR